MAHSRQRLIHNEGLERKKTRVEASSEAQLMDHLEAVLVS